MCNSTSRLNQINVDHVRHYVDEKYKHYLTVEQFYLEECNEARKLTADEFFGEGTLNLIKV